MKLYAFVFFILIKATSFGQTRLIAFKSHSGSNENFRLALQNNLFDMDESDFGVGPIEHDYSDMIVRRAQLDSVIFISNSMTILVTSNFCTKANRILTEPIEKSERWKPGREIAYNNPLFSKSHSLDSIKRIIQEKYSFGNNVEKVVFVGYDNNKCKEDSITDKYIQLNNPGFTATGNSGDDHHESPVDAEFIFMLSSILFLAFSGGFIIWKKYKWQSRKMKKGIFADAF